jgi:hypothetical protein
MRREDTIPFLSEFLTVRPAPMLEYFRAWCEHRQRYHRPFDEYGCRIDHLSYKCVSVREYEDIRSRFEEHLDGWRASRFIHQSIISGRRVAVIGLVDPIQTALGALRVLELSEPKPMRAEAYGYDHLEVAVRNVQLRIAAEVFSAVPKATGEPGVFVLKDRPHHATWDAAMPGDEARGWPPFILRLTSEPLAVKIGHEML